MNHTRVAKVVFALDAVLGTLAVGGAALYGAAWSSENVWEAFFTTFAPFTVLWLLICYAAYKGLTSGNIILKFVFWAYVLFNVFVFPVGTAISAASIWLWRELRK